MATVLSCGVLVWNRERIFACHATGSPRWDLPKGVRDAGEAERTAALREAWEEAGLLLPPDALHDLGGYAYLSGKRLHLFAVHAADGALDTAACCCRSFFVHRTSGRRVPEADAFAWQPLAERERWAGKGLARLLGRLDWALVRALPALPVIDVDTTSASDGATGASCP